MYSPFGHVAFWYAALGEDASMRPAAYPFAPPEAAGDEEPARGLAQRLREQPEEVRKPLLRVLYGKASVLPWPAVHPSWLREVLAACRPGWRRWALDTLPSALRAALEEDAGPLPDGEAPAWWPAFFSAHVKSTLGYPDLPPWEGAPVLPGSLWERETHELTRLLAFHGTRGLVSTLRQLPREEAQRWMWLIPPECQGLAQETAQNRAWYEDPFWPRIFQELETDSPELTSRIFRAALADCLRAGVQQGQSAHLRRLAFRLPRDWGLFALRQLGAAPAWLEMPVLPDLPAWRRSLQELLAPGGAS